MTPDDTTPPSALGLDDYLAILNRRKWVIIQSVLIVGIVAFVLSARQEKVFQASADVLTNRQSISNAVTGITTPDAYASPERFLETQAGLARSPAVANLAVENAGLDDAYTGDDLLNDSSVLPRSNADLLQFIVQNTDRDRAAGLANAYATAFTTYKAELDTGQLVRARKEIEKRLAELRRSGQQGSDAYVQLTNNAQQLRTMELLQQRNIVVRPATGADQIAPTPQRNAMLGAFLGLLLGLGMAFLWEALDKRIRKEEEIETRLGLPLLGRLPTPPKSLQGARRLAMIDEPQGGSAEAVRQLRTSLEFANLDERARLVMITSSVEGEGKSTTAANLAVALARGGKSVALVDLDLRHPSLADVFGLKGHTGLTDVVLGRTSLTTALRLFPHELDTFDPIAPEAGGRAAPSGVGRLDVLPSGAVPSNPGELVGSHALAEILRQLREEHDYVLIDSAPLLAVGDSMALTATVDGVIVVTRLGVVDRGMLRDLKRSLDAVPAAKLGFVITGTDTTDGYGYHYGTKHRPTGDVPQAVPPSASEAAQRREQRAAATR